MLQAGLALGLWTTLVACGGRLPLPLPGAGLVGAQALSSPGRDPVAWTKKAQQALPPALAKQRLGLLLASPHAWFRGSAGLFAQDLARSLPQAQWGPKLQIQGDAHLENLGTMALGTGVAYGPNDFDESCQAPLAFELVRLLCSVHLAAKEQGQPVAGLPEALLEAYAQAAASGKAKLEGPAQEALEEAQEAMGDREDWIKPYVKDHALEASPKLLAVGASEAQPLLEAIKGWAAQRREGASFFRVKDLKRRLAGLGSYGRPRYWLLVEGPSDGKKDDRILDLKLAAPCAWSGLPGVSGTGGPEGPRVVHALQAFWPGGDPYLSALKVGSGSYVLRERGPALEGSVDLAKLRGAAWPRFMAEAGAAYALAHLRAGASGAALASAVRQLGPTWLRVAASQPDRVEADWRAVKAQLGTR